MQVTEVTANLASVFDGLLRLVVFTVVFFTAFNLLEAKSSFVSQAIAATRDNVAAFLEDASGKGQIAGKKKPL